MHLTDKKKKNTNQLPKIEYKNLNIRQTQAIVHATQLKQCLSKMLQPRQPNIKYKHYPRYLFSSHIPISRVCAFLPDRLVFVVLLGVIYIEETDREGFQWAAMWLRKETVRREGHCVSLTLTHPANDRVLSGPS